jgi:hypothetical protein
MLSLSVYLPLWLGFTWSEMKRERGDERMRPLWHALSLFVPGYGYWQVYRHFRTIDSLASKVHACPGADALSATLGIVVWSLTFLHYSTEPIFTVLNVIELGAATVVVVYGQRVLNAYWATRPGPAVEGRVLQTDWLALAIAATYFVATVIGYITVPNN